MELILHTYVKGHYREVLEQFDQKLFLLLAPSFPTMHLLRFDGSRPGDHVAIELQLGPFRQKWTSLITEKNDTGTAAWFTDEGQQLPPPLKTWKHQHLVTQLSENVARITDHITFSTGLALLDRLVYLVLYAQFAARRPVYEQFFGKAS